MRSTFLCALIFLGSAVAEGQTNFGSNIYYVTSPELNLRTGPGDNAFVILKIPQYAPVAVLQEFSSGWWLVSYGSDSGFAYFKFLSKQNPDPFADWEKIPLSTGQQPPQCDNIVPSYDSSLNNHLKIMDMSNEYDVIVKLVGAYSGVCIRAAFVKAGDSFYMRNIPEGIYVVKEAYGNDFRRSIRDGKCRLRFVRNAIYKKFDSTLNFYNEYTSDGKYLREYELELGTSSSIDTDYHQISGSEENEDDFNK